jgi:hypothetical protein
MLYRSHTRRAKVMLNIAERRAEDDFIPAVDQGASSRLTGENLINQARRLGSIEGRAVFETEFIE